MLLDDAEMALRSGIEYIGNRELEKAEEVIQKVTEDYPDSGISWLYYGDVLLLQERIKEAKTAHQKAVKLDLELWFPRVSTAFTQQGVEYQVLLGDFAGKTLIQRPIIPGQDEPMSLQRTLSLLALGSGLQMQAGITVAVYVELFKNSLMSDADSVAEQLQQDDSRFGLWREYGSILHILDRHEEATNAFSKALQIDPRDRLSQRGLIRSYRFMTMEERYSRFAKHQAVQATITQLSQAEQVDTQTKRKASDVIIGIDIIQIAGNADFVHKEYKNI